MTLRENEVGLSSLLGVISLVVGNESTGTCRRKHMRESKRRKEEEKESKGRKEVKVFLQFLVNTGVM